MNNVKLSVQRSLTELWYCASVISQSVIGLEIKLFLLFNEFFSWIQDWFDLKHEATASC